MGRCLSTAFYNPCIGEYHVEYVQCCLACRAALYNSDYLGVCDKTQRVTAEPAAPVAAAAESRPEIAPTPSLAAEQPAPSAAAEQALPEHPAMKVGKKRVKARIAKPKVATPEPAAVSAPTSDVQQATPVAAAPAPSPIEVSTLPVQKVEPGFLEKYWLWLLGIVIVAIALLVFRKKE